MCHAVHAFLALKPICRLHNKIARGVKFLRSKVVSMAVKHQTYNLTTTPVLLGVINDTDNNIGMTIIFNTDKENNATTMIGSSTVTDTDFGIHLDADESFTLQGHFTYQDQFWARAKTGTAILHVLLAGA